MLLKAFFQTITDSARIARPPPLIPKARPWKHLLPIVLFVANRPVCCQSSCLLPIVLFVGHFHFLRDIAITKFQVCLFRTIPLKINAERGKTHQPSVSCGIYLSEAFRMIPRPSPSTTAELSCAGRLRNRNLCRIWH